MKKRATDLDLLPVTLPRVRAPPKRLEQKNVTSPPVSYTHLDVYKRQHHRRHAQQQRELGHGCDLREDGPTAEEARTGPSHRSTI